MIFVNKDIQKCCCGSKLFEVNALIYCDNFHHDYKSSINPTQEQLNLNKKIEEFCSNYSYVEVKIEDLGIIVRRQLQIKDNKLQFSSFINIDDWFYYFPINKENLWQVGLARMLNRDCRFDDSERLFVRKAYELLKEELIKKQEDFDIKRKELYSGNIRYRVEITPF